MVLPDIFLSTRALQNWEYSGIDSPEYALNKNHFKNYPHKITYCYNTRGFRDYEWPENLSDAIWCLGDSFTAGIGCPLVSIWPQILQKQTGTRTINVSLDGASNQWIARKAQRILSEIKPKVMVIQWSYTTRRERPVEQIVEAQWQKFYRGVKDPTWPQVSFQQKQTLPQFIQQELQQLHNYDLYKFTIETALDEDRRINVTNATSEQDIEDTMQCIKQLKPWESSTTIIHSFIPNAIEGADSEKFFINLEKEVNMCIQPFSALDIARDGHHYDKLTAEHFVATVIQLLNRNLNNY